METGNNIFLIVSIGDNAILTAVSTYEDAEKIRQSLPPWTGTIVRLKLNKTVPDLHDQEEYVFDLYGGIAVKGT